MGYHLWERKPEEEEETISHSIPFFLLRTRDEEQPEEHSQINWDSIWHTTSDLRKFGPGLDEVR